jgi:hypothetical protein
MKKSYRLSLHLDESQEAEMELLPEVIFIFQHRLASVSYHSVQRYISRFTDDRFYDIREWFKKESYPDMFYDTLQRAIRAKRRIVLLGYNPALAFCVKDFVDAVREKSHDRVVCLSFFHDDEETSKLHIQGIEDILDARLKLMVNMLNYPFIKKVTVPFNHQVTVRYLVDLSRELLAE